MTKETIIDDIKFEMIDRLGIPGALLYTEHELQNAMVAAYNRALEDAAKSIDPELCNYEESSACSQDEIIEGILKLKIND
jgi:hypothetical protein